MSDAPPPPAPVVHLGARPPADADPRPGGEGLPSLGEARAHAPGPKWYRLGEESWAMIRAEYLAGATAKQLALKWGVSATSVYRHACQEGWTKERRGEAINLEAVTRFAARAAETGARLEAQADAEARARVEREAEHDPREAADILVRRAAARSLAGRTEEALALLKTAEALRRAADAAPATTPAGDEEAEDAWETYDNATIDAMIERLNRNLGLGRAQPRDDGGAAAEV